MENIALWMSQPHFSYLEIARTCGFSSFVLELEHGTFDLSTLDQFLAFTKAQGLSTLTKVLAPTPEAIQQALDFGSDGVIVPHILGVEHAQQVTKAAKYPLVGTRSYTGGRIFGYARPATDAFEKENKRTKCFAMIETAESLADVEKIIALDTVDGLFPGPWIWRLRGGGEPTLSMMTTRPTCAAARLLHALPGSRGSCPPGPKPNGASRRTRAPRCWSSPPRT